MDGGGGEGKGGKGGRQPGASRGGVLTAHSTGMRGPYVYLPDID